MQYTSFKTNLHEYYSCEEYNDYVNMEVYHTM